MKALKRLLPMIVALVATMAFAATAFAADGDFMTDPETTIEATNVTAGDSVAYYQLAGWDAATGNWKLTTLGESCGVTLENLIDGITEAEATTIAGNVSGAGTAMTADAADPTKFTATVAPGLYFLRATPAADNKDTVYNPAFVSADYYEGGNTVSFASTIGTSTVMKKSEVPFEKEVNSTTDNYADVKPGDIIPFKVTTEIPSYGTSFTNPQFSIDDTLSEGLTLEGNVTVKYGDKTTTATNDDVTITPKAGGSGYTVTFTQSYLTGLAGATPDVEITYSAKVTTEGTNNVTYMDNKAKLTFSNTPSTTSDKEDITRHYTFAIDGDLLGHTGEEGSELIKTGVDAEGNPLTENHKTYHNETVSALAEATFKLEGVAGTPTAGVSQTKQSDSNGRINFDGLDAGTYKLTEVSAPAGFVKDSREFTVTITPTYDEDGLLQSYTITITADGGYNGGATFTMTNEGGVTTVSSPEDASNFIENKQGTELPSTGDMGTTILYIIGGALVLFAGVALFARHVVRKQSKAKLNK